MRVAFVHSNDGTDVRVSKVCRSLSSFGYDVHFIGWDRRPQLSKVLQLGNTRSHLLIRPTRFGKMDYLGEFQFAAHIAKSIARIRPNIVCAVNEDTALLCLPFKRIFFRYLFCDIFDGLSDRLSNRSWFIRQGLSVVSWVCRKFSDRLIATDEPRFRRFGQNRQKTKVIENVPEDPGPSLSRKFPSGTVKIWVGGSLAEDRGLRQILSAIEDNEQVQILAAGWPYDAFASDVFAKHDKVEFHGILTSRESLELAASCDAIFAFYAPYTVNHRLASPNKMYDAMAVGRPLITNDEIGIARSISDNQLGFSCAYDDVESLRAIVCDLVRHRDRLPTFATRARKLFLQGHTWQTMEERLADLYGEYSS